MIGLTGELIDRWAFWRVQRQRLSLRGAPGVERRLDGGLARRILAGAVNVEPLGGIEVIETAPSAANGRSALHWRAATDGEDAPRGPLFGDPSARRAVVHVHGWMQPDYMGFAELAAYFTARGAAVWCFELPHHLSRRRPGEPAGKRFISGDIEATLEAFRQSLAELTAFISALSRRHEEVVTLGHSLGGLLTGLHLCLARRPQERAALLTPAVDPRGILLNSPLTRSVRTDILEQGFPLDWLRELLAPLNLLSYRPSLPDSALLVAARSDQVIPLAVQRRLRDVWGCRYHETATGHLGVFLPLIWSGRPRGLWRAIVEHLCPSTD